MIDRISVSERPSGPALVDRDLRAHDLLVELVAHAQHRRPRGGVERPLAVALGLDPARERQPDRGGDVVVERVPLGRLELLGVLLGVGQRADRVAELLLHVRVDRRRRAPRCRAGRTRTARAGAAARRRRSSCRRSRAALPAGCASILPGSADRPPSAIAAARARAVRRAQRLGDRTVDPLGLPALAASSIWSWHSFLISPWASSSAAIRSSSAISCAPASTIVMASGAAADDQVERRVLQVGQRRVDDELTVDAADAHRADRAQERHRRQHQRRRRAVDGQDVVRVHLVGRERGHDDLDLVLVALRPQRPDRPVDHAGGQDRLLAGASLALEEPARDLAGGVGLLLDVDREREEVRPLTTLGAADRGGEHHGAFLLHQDRSVRLLGDGAGLEADLLVADGGDKTRRSGLNCNAHISLFSPRARANRGPASYLVARLTGAGPAP